MTRIELTTPISGAMDEIFDLSRDIDFHMQAASQTSERAIAGTTSGLIGLNQTVIWKGKHLGFWLKHTSKIVVMEAPYRFVDLMIKGHFTYFVHKHEFIQEQQYVLMKDVLMYKVPYGWLGKLVDRFLLKGHLRRFLKHRNQQIKKCIENKGQSGLINHKLLGNTASVAS